MKNILTFAYGSLAVGMIGLILKYYAYHITGSVALYSDALECIVNIVASVVMFITVRLSITPADRNHHYGHYKAEYLSAVFEGIFIIIAALAIFHEAYHGYFHPRRLDEPIEGLLISGLATVINGIWALIIINRGKYYRSLALVADGKHLLADLISSIGVLFGVSLAVITDVMILDPLIAVLCGVHILWSGWKLIKESVDGLMDKAPDAKEMAKIKAIINANNSAAKNIHNLKVRHAGRAVFIDFHLVVEGEMTVSASHAICDQIEAALHNAYEDAIISIHVEPED